ncbi:helix-turn-helix domain-containing protein [Brachybacterium paraconglomeratum]
MTVRQVAETLAVSEHVVRRLLVSTDLQGVKVGREWRVLRADLLRYLLERSNSVEGRS